MKEPCSETQEQIEARRAAKRKYNATPKAKAARQRWATSPGGKAWLKARYEKRREMAVEYLGGACVRCSTDECLQFDHVDPEDKSYEVSRRYSYAWEILVIELDKCQLLCKPCHTAKTREDR